MIDIIYFDRKTADALRSADVKEPGGPQSLRVAFKTGNRRQGP